MKTISRTSPVVSLSRKFFAGCALLFLCASAHAANDTWTGATSVNWGDANWTGGGTTPATGDSLFFGATATSGTALIDNLMTSSTNVAGITFNASAASFVINPGTVGTNGFTLTGNITNNSTSLETINDLITTTVVRTYTGVTGSELILGGNIAGTGGAFTVASGTLALTGSNSFTGNTSVGATTAVLLLGSNYALGSGTLLMSNNGMVGSTSGTVNIANTVLQNNSAMIFGGNQNLTISGSFVNGGTALVSVTNTGTTIFSSSIDIRNATGTRTLELVGTGNVLVSGTILNGATGATGSLQWANSGTLTLSGTNTYTGASTFQAGTVILDASTATGTASLATSGVTVAGGGAIGSVAAVTPNAGAVYTGNTTLLIKGNYIIGNSTAVSGAINPTLTITGNAGTATNSNGTLSLQDNTINTLTINNASGNRVVLTMGNNSNLNMDVGSTSDEIILGGTGETGLTAAITNTVNVSINGLGNLNGATQTLIQTGSNQTFTVGAGKNFNLASTSGNLGGYVVALSAATNGALQLTETLTYTTPSVAYWSGTVGAGGVGTWNTMVNGNANNTNWATSSTGLTDTNQIVGATGITGSGSSNVFFGLSGGAGSNINTVLGANTTVDSVNFTSTSGTVGIGGVANTLTINAAGTPGNPGGAGNGISMASGAGATTISTNVALGGNQTWTLNGGISSPLTVSGTVSGAHNLTIGGNGELVFKGANIYTGMTTLSQGYFFVNGNQSAATGAVMVSATGASSVAVLGGTGTIGASSVTIATPTPANSYNLITGNGIGTVGTLTLSNGLTLQNGSIAYFDFNSLSAPTLWDEISLASGGLTLNAGSIFAVPATLNSGTYALFTGVGASLSGTGGIVLDYSNGSATNPIFGPAGGNYSLFYTTAGSGTLELVVAAASTAIPTLTINNIRVMAGQSGILSGTVGNAGSAGATLSGTLSDGGGNLAINTFSSSSGSFTSGSTVSLGIGSSAPYSATVAATGSGNQTVIATVTDGNAGPPDFATATGTASVLQNRAVTASTVSFGVIHAGANTLTTTLSTAGADSTDTRLTVANAGADSNGVAVTGGTNALFNGASVTDTRNVGGNITGLGAISGTISLASSGENLAGEVDAPVQVIYSGTTFSGKASWALNGNGSWAANGNWGDTNALNLGGIGAPGVSGALSIGDTATFNDVPSQSGTITVSLNGATPTLAGITFNSTNGYLIAPGSGGTITLQSAAFIAVNSGTGAITAALAGSGGWSLSSTGNGVLALGGANTFTGGITINSGVLEATAANVLNSNNITFGASAPAGTMLVLNGNNTTIGNLNSNATPGSPVVENLNAAAALLTLGGGNFAGTIQDGVGGGVLSLKIGGALTLSGNNTYTGSTSLAAGGALTLGSANALAGTTLISFGGGSLVYSASNQVDYSGVFSTASGQTYNINTNGVNVTYNTAIAGTGDSLVKTGLGQLTLNAVSTYTGSTGVIQGVLQTTGTNLLANTSSPALSLSSPGQALAGGVWQPLLTGPTTINITIGTGAGNVSWLGGGFAAVGGPLTITANGGAQLVWGSGGFAGGGGNGITFGSATANNQVILTNSINLNTSDAFQQYIFVNGTNTGDSALLTGQITQQTGTGAASGLKKSGVGMLILSNTTSNFSGFIFVEQGSLVAAGNSVGSGGGVFGTGTGTSVTPTAPSAISLGDGNTIANSNPSLYIQGAYQVDRNITAVNETVGNNTYNVGGLLDASGTFSGTISVQTLAANNNFFDITQVATTGADALYLTGGIVSNNGAGESVNFANAGAVDVTGTIAGTGFQLIQSGPGTTTLTNAANTYTGSTILNAGVLQLGVNVTGSDGIISNSSNIQDNASLVYDYAGNQTYSGTISGAGNITVEGSGTVDLTAGNTNTGIVNVTSIATLQLGNGTAGHDGLLAGNLVDNGVTNFDYAGSQTYSGTLSGAGTVNVIGSGTVALASGNSFTGNVNVDNGDLRAGNSAGSATGSGTVNVTPNLGGIASLSGNGTFSGSVIIAAASGPNVAHIAPGANASGAAGNFGGIGTLTFGNGLSIGNGTNLDFDLGTSSDLIAVTGQLTLGTGVVLNVNQAAGFAAGTYTLFTYSGLLTGDDSTWTAAGLPGGDNATFNSGGGIVTVTITQSNNSTLVITPTPATPAYISLGSVLEGSGSTGPTTIVTGSNGGTIGTGTYSLVTTGSVSVTPTNTSLAASGTTGLTVHATFPIGAPSGNNQVIGQVSATNSANTTGSLSPVNVTANVYQAFSGSVSDTINSGTTATLSLTNTLNTDGGATGQRAGATVTGWSTTNSNFIVTTDNGGVVGVASGGNNSATVDVGTVSVATNLLSGTYNYTGSVTGTTVYTDTALRNQGTPAQQTWTGIALSGTVNATASYGQTKQAFINSGSSFAGYGLTSSQGNGTTATLLNGAASANSTITMSFSANGSLGGNETAHPSSQQSSDTLTLGGLHPTGATGADGQAITDPYVLQLNVANAQAGTNYYLGWYDPNFNNTGHGAWVNAIAGNSTANLPADYDITGAYFTGPGGGNPDGSYAAYLAANGFTLATPLTQELGAYGYDAADGTVWAVLNYDSDVEVIPEPGTYALVFSGFGVLIGFRKLRRRRNGSEK